MKKFILLTACAVSVFLACRKTNDRFEPSPSPVVSSSSITAQTSDGIDIGQNAIMSAWKLDNKYFYYTASETGKSVKFNLNEGQDIPTGIAYAVFPDIVIDSLHHGEFSVKLVPAQTTGADETLSDYSLYAGHVADNAVTLHKLTGEITFNINQNHVGIFELSATNSISGHAIVKMSQVPVAQPTGDGSKTVSLSGNLEQGKTFSVAVLPGKYENATVVLKTASGRKLFSSTLAEPIEVTPTAPADLGFVGEPDKPLDPGDVIAIAGSFADGETTIDGEWKEGDQISIFASGKNEKFSLKSGKGTSSAIFNGAVLTETSPVALYPYDAEAVYSASEITSTLNSSQTLVPTADGAISNSAIISVGEPDPETNEILFSNACGLIKFKLKGDNVGEIVITGNNDENLAGKVKLSKNGKSLACTAVAGEKSVSLKPADGPAFTSGTYYASVIPQAFENGVTFTLTHAKFTTDAVLKRVFAPSNKGVFKTEEPVNVEIAKITDLGEVDAGIVWNYSNLITMAALRSPAAKVKTDSGIYIDFSTGRTFWPIGVQMYCRYLDVCMITNGSNGVAPAATSTAGGFTNATNIGYFGTHTADDYIANWPFKLTPKFCYVAASELSDDDYNNLDTIEEIKALYESHEAKAVTTYYGSTPNCVTNANRVSTNKFLVVKTYSDAEGTGYAIIKFNGISGAPWAVQFFYKFALEKTQDIN